MNAKMTIGQFYPADSLIHRLDARVKLIGTFFVIIALFLADNLIGYGIAAVFLAVVIGLSRVPPRFLLRGLRAIVFIIVFAAVLNLFFTPGETVILAVGFLRMTAEGLLTAIRMVLRLVLLVTVSSLMTLTTSPLQLTGAMETLFAPLKKCKVPVHELTMMMTLALRFIPTLVEETDKIMKAQMARGADFDTGGLYKKAKSLVPLLVPLFVSAFRRADELAVAMDARCYRGDINRTKMTVMRFAVRDLYAGLALLAFGAAMLISWRLF